MYIQNSKWTSRDFFDLDVYVPYHIKANKYETVFILILLNENKYISTFVIGMKVMDPHNKKSGQNYFKIHRRGMPNTRKQEETPTSEYYLLGEFCKVAYPNSVTKYPLNGH